MIIPCNTLKHDYQLITVPSEKLTCRPSEVECLQDQDGVKYSVHGWFSYDREDAFPSGLLLTSTGKEMTPEQVWGYYHKSKKIVIFIAKKI